MQPECNPLPLSLVSVSKRILKHWRDIMVTTVEAASHAARFLEQPKRMLVDGEWAVRSRSMTPRSAR